MIRDVAKIMSIAVVFGLLPLGQLSAAASTTYLTDTTVTVAGVDLKIMAGSVQDSLTVTNDNLTVSVPEGEAFIIRSPGIYPKPLENDALLAACTVLKNRDNQLLIAGPRTVTLHPSAYACSTANYTTNTTPFVTVSVPTSGQTVNSGSQLQLFWQNEGTGANAVRLRLSTAETPDFSTVIAAGIANNGYFNWEVPSVYTTDFARIKIEGMDGQGNIKAIAVSPAFHIEGMAPPGPKTWDFDPDALVASSGATGLGALFTPAIDPATAACAAGLLIKSKSNPAVYVCGADGKRHAFPNQRIYDSWFAGDFAGVVEVSDSSLASIQLGKNATYRPGMRMVKITTDPKVYAVADGNVLRWVPSEEAAVALYGANWNTKIDDLPDAFFTDYTIGEQIK
jgi:hypothetical protein